MKKLSALLLVVALMLVCVGSYAKTENKIEEPPKLEPLLTKKLEESTRSDIIPVMIRLNDDFDVAKLEQELIKELGMEDFFAAEQENSQKYTNEEIRAYKDEFIDVKYDRLNEYYKEKNYGFLEKYGLTVENELYVCPLTATIYRVNVPKALIEELVKDPEVKNMSYLDGIDVIDASGNSMGATALIDGGISYTAGYKGSGVKVGVVEQTPPSSSVMGSTDYSRVHIVSNSDNSSAAHHCTKVCGIILDMAPQCDIYVYVYPNTGSTTESAQFTNLLAGITYLINTTKVDVVNVSQETTYSSSSAYLNLDKLIKNSGVPVVAATGNSAGVINYLSTPANVIAVGGITYQGGNNDIFNLSNPAIPDLDNDKFLSPGQLEYFYLTSYLEQSYVLWNKPDVCAPAGPYQIYSYRSDSGTSFAAPYVVGCIVQAIDRNSYIAKNSEQIKAMVIGSAYTNNNSVRNAYPTTTTQSGHGLKKPYTSTTENVSSSKLGQGVVNAAYCYDVASTGRRHAFTFTNQSAQTFTKDIYVDYTNRYLSVAISWSLLEAQGSSGFSKYTLSVSKKGSTTVLASASQTANNCQVVRLSPSTLATHGAGYYTVTVTRTTNTNASYNETVGLAWQQLRP